MLLQHVHIIGQHEPKNIKISEDKIQAINPNKLLPEQNTKEQRIGFDKAIIFPGLINSHDHLEFNLFPQLGNLVYNNYLEWGADIHKQNKETIEMILKIPEQIRVEWGVFKNLLNGFTTVVHHGKYFNIKNPLIHIFQQCYSLHSVRLEKNWKFKLNKLFARDQPYVIHIGEGTDRDSFEEINELIRWNILKKKLIAVHGVSMNIQQAKAFEALIWCPDSNFFLLRTTARVDQLKNDVAILFGTDSTVSANWNAWEQIRLAQKTKMLTDTELFNSLTGGPADTWNLPGSGVIKEGANADVIVANMKDQNDPLKSFLQLNPEDILLIIKKGEIIYFDESLHSQLIEMTNNKKFHKFFINNKGKYVKTALTELVKEIKKYYPEIKLPIEIQ